MLTYRTYKVLRKFLAFVNVAANLTDITLFLLLGFRFDVVEIVLIGR